MTNPQSALTLTEAPEGKPLGFDRANFNRDVRSITRRSYAGWPVDCTEVVFTDERISYVLETPEQIDGLRFEGGE